MNQPASILCLALLAAACSGGTPPQSAASPSTPSVEDSKREDELTDDVFDRRIALRAEIRALGSPHPWAGEYYYGDGLGVNVLLTVAPRGGCTATWNGCMGLYGKNYGRVSIDGNRLHVEFALPNTPGEFGHFDCDYTIEGSGENRLLRPPDDRDVLRPVDPRRE